MYFPGEVDENISDSSDEESDEDWDDSDEEETDSPYAFENVQGGDVYSFGYGYFGQLGHGTLESSSLPKKIASIKNVVHVSCGEGHSIAVTGNGQVFSWGCNRYGQLGLGDIQDRFEPTLIESISSLKMADVACGPQHSALLSRAGEIFTFGCGTLGRLGHGDNKHFLQPKIVTTLRGKRIIQISCGGTFTVCLSNAGAMYSWGCNKYGQLGHGKNPQTQIFPRHISSLYGKPIIKISCGKHHTIALTDDGECFSFGAGMCGQLGHRGKQNIPQPKLIESFAKKKIVDVSCGNLHTIALTSDGKLFIWGYVSEDHIGLSEGDEYHSAPLHVNTSHLDNRIVKLGAGAWHSSALTNKGELYTWGLSHRGRLGNGEPTDFDNDIAFSPSLPNKVEIVSRQFVLDMACGGAHTLAIVIELDDSVKTTVASSNEPAKTSTTELEQ